MLLGKIVFYGTFVQLDLKLMTNELNLLKVIIDKMGKIIFRTPSPLSLKIEQCG